MDNRLETFDRATLGLWRTTNTVLWGVLAAGVGVVLLQAFQRVIQQILARLHWNLFSGGLFFDLNQRMDPAHWTFWWVLPRYFVRSIGALIPRGAVIVGDPGGIAGWLYEGVGLLAILSAALWARHVARRHA